jgi:hypothetical protein
VADAFGQQSTPVHRSSSYPRVPTVTPTDVAAIVAQISGKIASFGNGNSSDMVEVRWTNASGQAKVSTTRCMRRDSG